MPLASSASSAEGTVARPSVSFTAVAAIIAGATLGHDQPNELAVSVLLCGLPLARHPFSFSPSADSAVHKCCRHQRLAPITQFVRRLVAETPCPGQA